jgi:hypothetical protein
MNRDSEDFEAMRRLLALKRHEQPPPGYFRDFSGRVLARIEAGERGADASGLRYWMQNFWALLEARPAFSGAMGAALCALLLAGMFAGAPQTPVGAHSFPPVTYESAAVAQSPVDTGLVATPPATNGNGSIEDIFKAAPLPSVRVSAPVDLLHQN